MEATTIVMAILMGFTGSLHCAGMCGPIVWIMPFQAFGGARKVVALLLYHGARVSAYALLAIAVHSFRDIFDPKVQQYISVILGSLLLALGLISFFPNRGLHMKLPWGEFVKKQLGHVIGRPRLGAITIAGLLNGLLPCGLVYMALSASMTQATTAQAVGLIYLFGFGTLPMLIGITVLKSKISSLHTQHIKKLVPLVVFSLGCLFVLRGMNLGIPYLSPKVVVEGQQIHSCCHKK